ncbi:MAG TPA: efflux RND transporter periplasmic adaptor subunit [Steroidobacteraceae bacterium]|nr:efflux RND transporter periplasmic adaptor subunit [Steroidobacteraceae bacterium]
MSMPRLNKLTWGAGVLALLALGAGVGYWWAQRTMSPAMVSGTADASGDAAPPAGAASGQRKILYWHDPMVPNVKFDKPGKSPFMDMQLVPVYAEEGGGGDDVRVSANVVQNLGIRTAKVEKATLPAQLRAVGSVVFDERLLEVVQTRVEGYVTSLHVKAPLERVRRGQPLASIVAPQWLEAEREYLALLDARSLGAQPIREAARQRLVVLGVPEATIRTVETTRTPDASTTVFAPIDGTVTELGVREGAAFTPGTTLFRINGLATVWVNAQIPEAKVSFIPTGSTVMAHATAWPGTAFEGQVIALLPDVDRETRTLTARVALKNPAYKLSPGMYVSLEFTGPAGEPQLLVPSEAVITTGERSVVIVARDDGAFDVVNVTVGNEQDGRSTILSGLGEGQSIVVSGQFLIDSEANLKSTSNRLEAHPSTDGPPSERQP